MKNKKTGFTRQGIKDLNFIKGPSVGRRLEMPPQMAGEDCDHYGTVREVDSTNGISQCSRCKQAFNFSGDAI